MVCWSIVLGCAPAQRDWAPPQHSSSQLPRKAFMCICRIPPPFGDRNRYKVDALKKKNRKNKTQNKNKQKPQQKQNPPKHKKDTKEPKTPKQRNHSPQIPSSPPRTNTAFFWSNAVEREGLRSLFPPALTLIRADLGLCAFPPGRSSSSSSQVWIPSLPPFSKGHFLLGQKTIKQKEWFALGSLLPFPLCPLLLFLFPCSTWVPFTLFSVECFPFFCLFVCSFVSLGFFCNKPMKSYSWSKFLKKRPQGNSSCFIQDFIQECNWNQQEQWGFWLHQVGWLLQAIKGYFVLGHKFPAA